MVNKDEYIFLSSLSVISVAILFKAIKLNLAIWRLEKGLALQFLCVNGDWLCQQRMAIFDPHTEWIPVNRSPKYLSI